MPPAPINTEIPSAWDTWGMNWLMPSVEGEWFAHVLRDCRRVLDIGSGAGRSSFYLASRLPEVVGVEPGKAEREHALSVQRNMGVGGNVTFLPGNALDLPFEDQTFDGALFSDSLELTGNIGRALSEAERILRPGGIIAITLVPFSEDTERISACITDDAHNVPVIRYEVTTSVPPTGRRYRVCLRPESDSGRRIKSSFFKAGRCGFSREELEEMLGASGLGSVTRIVYSCVSGITPADLREELLSLGFEQVTFWHPPSATEFASALHDEGYLHSISPEDHRALVRALARASRTGGSGSKVSAKKASRTEPTAQQHAPADADKPRR